MKANETTEAIRVAKTGRPVVTAENASTMLLGQTVAGMIESVATEKDDEKSE